MFIYLVTNTINGKSYVGKTEITVRDRWKSHLQNANNNKPNHLYRAIRKYGKEAFTVQTLAEANDAANLNDLERLWIILLGTHSKANGYNMTYGGDGVRATDEVKAKISKAMKGRTLSDAHKLLIGQMHKGKITSIETRQKMAVHWDDERKEEQAEIARRVNAVENLKLKDYTCADCGTVFKQVKKGVYGGHRKACLHWQRVEKWLADSDPATI